MQTQHFLLTQTPVGLDLPGGSLALLVSDLAPVGDLDELVELDNVGDALVRVDLLAVLEDLYLVLPAGGLVVKVRHPLAVGTDVLVVVEAALAVGRTGAQHGHHGLVGRAMAVVSLKQGKK